MKKTHKIIITSTILLIAVILIGQKSKVKETSSNSQMTEAVGRPYIPTGLHQAIEGYYSYHQKMPNKYIIQLQTQKTDLDLAPVMSSIRKRVMDILQRHAGTTPLCTELSSQYNNVFMAMFWEADSIWYDVWQNPNPGPNTIRVSMVPWEMRKHPVTNNFNFVYNSGYVLTSAAQFPEPLFAGLLMHEIGHAYRDEVKKSDHNLATSNPIAAEEVEMHTMEIEVIDAESRGQYLRLVNRIIDRVPKNHNFEEWRYNVLNTITLTDLFNLDTVLGTERSHYQVVKSGVSGLLRAIQFTMIDRFYSDNKEALEAKIANYTRFKEEAKKQAYRR